MSSKSWGKERGGSGILSADKTVNPYWYDANIIDIMYCSSDSHSGNQMKSDLGWNFMGSVIVESVVQEALDKWGLRSASQVLFSGSSAGAEGLYPNANRVAQQIGGNIPFLVALDSGWFLDYDPFKAGDCRQLTSCTEQGGLMRGVPHWNPRVDTDCAAAKKPNIWECMLGYHAFPFIKSPSFVFAYSYDAAGLGHDGIYSIPNTTPELAYANEAASNITKSLQSVSAHYVPACYHHTIELDNNWNKVLVGGKSYNQALYEWTQNPSQKVSLVDTCVGPNCNPTCKNL